eukprot:6175700-Pleurochrysis_carterae.AAC.2
MEGAGSGRAMAALGSSGRGGGMDNREPTAARPRRPCGLAGASSQQDPRSVALQRQRQKKPKERLERARMRLRAAPLEKRGSGLHGTQPSYRLGQRQAWVADDAGQVAARGVSAAWGAGDEADPTVRRAGDASGAAQSACGGTARADAV